MSKVKVLTEKQAEQNPLPCGYNPDVVVSLSLRVSNTLYQDLKNETEKTGYNSIAEFLRQAAIEKIQRSKEVRAELNLKERQAYA